MGGILLVDEAYYLYNAANDRDYGQASPCLLPHLPLHLPPTPPATPPYHPATHPLPPATHPLPPATSPYQESIEIHSKPNPDPNLNPDPLTL